MTGQLRQRSAVPKDGGGACGGRDATTTMLDYDESLLSARALLAASPVHSSPAMKIHVPAVYSFLPATVQWLLSRFCPKSLSPQWKPRYLIALGEYIYRFKDENGSSPKGTPIPAIMTDIRLLSNDDIDGADFNILLEMLPVGYEAIFEISSIGKTQYFAVQSREEATLWVNTLRQMRQDAISRSMGHTHGSPYPPKWKSFDASAKRLSDKKTRIKNKLEEMNRKEQEMQSLGGGAAGVNIGYYN